LQIAQVILAGLANAIARNLQAGDALVIVTHMSGRAIAGTVRIEQLDLCIGQRRNPKWRFAAGPFARPAVHQQGRHADLAAFVYNYIVDPAAIAMPAPLSWLFAHDRSSASSRPSLPRIGYDRPEQARTATGLLRKSETVSDFLRCAGGLRFNKFLRFM
jgi:hypothetical protein